MEVKTYQLTTNELRIEDNQEPNWTNEAKCTCYVAPMPEEMPNNMCELLEDVSKIEQIEEQEALHSIFERFTGRFTTADKEGDYLIFSLNSEMLKEFTQIIFCISKMSQNFTLRFLENGLHSSAIQDNGRGEIFLALFRSFFYSFTIEKGLEIEVTISLEELMQKLTRARRKEACDIIYFVVCSSGIGICAKTRKHKETISSFCPKIHNKSELETNSLELSPKGNQDPELKITGNAYWFLLSSERFLTNANSFTKTKQCQHNNLLHLTYEYPTNILTLSSSNQNVSDDYIQFYPVVIRKHLEYEENKELEKGVNFQGTFSSTVISSFCKLSPVITLGVSSESRSLILKTYFKELSNSYSEMSYLKIILFEEDTQFLE